MKNSMLLKYSWCFFAGILAFAGASQNSYGTANETIPSGQPIRWNMAAPIPYVVNTNGVAGFTTDLQKLIVVAAIDDAFRAWTNIPQASIHFTNAGSSQSTGTAGDGVNTISFQDPSNTILFRPGTLAITSTYFATTAGTIQLGSKAIDVVVGQIIDADITFNPNARDQSGQPLVFSPIGGKGGDLVAILMHEVGHLLGLDHTGVLSSIMNPFGEAGSGVASRTLQLDDALSAAALYPDPSFSPAPGAISGTITSAAGSPIKSAHVVAISVPGGVPIESQLSGADGTFSLGGLPPGNYQVMVEPLDGPVSLANFPGFYSSNAQTNFASTFFGGLQNPTTVAVTSGRATPVNLSAPPTVPGLLNATVLSSVLQAQGGGVQTFSPSAQYLPRGNAYALSVAGATLSTDSNFQFNAPASEVTPQGLATTPSDISLPNNTIRRQNLSISPTATLGPSNFFLSNVSSMSDVPGGIVVTVNPNITAIFNAASSGTPSGNTLAPGTLFSLYGTDVAAKADSWLGAPAPTNLGGVSVKVGDRYAPLFLTCPGPQSCGQFQQINGMLPFEVSGPSVPITIEAGPNAAGKTITVTLSPTAPGIFSTDSSGNGQGAILNGSDNRVAAPAGTFPGSHPARPGDVVMIYAAGLGPVNATLPSGLGSGVNGTPFPQLARLPQVQIGGQPIPVPAANFQFAGLAPGFVGLYQLNIQLPANVPTGSAVPLQITTAEGQISNTVTLAIGP